MEEGDLLHFITWGGGGWGDPLDREADLVAKEIRQGLVTSEGAKSYGVVADANGVLDVAATDAMRAKLRASAAPATVFDRGGEIEELRARCKDETGLDAPKPPVWTHAIAAE